MCRSSTGTPFPIFITLVPIKPCNLPPKIFSQLFSVTFPSQCNNTIGTKLSVSRDQSYNCRGGEKAEQGGGWTKRRGGGTAERWPIINERLFLGLRVARHRHAISMSTPIRTVKVVYEHARKIARPLGLAARPSRENKIFSGSVARSIVYTDLLVFHDHREIRGRMVVTLFSTPSLTHFIEIIREEPERCRTMPRKKVVTKLRSSC